MSFDSLALHLVVHELRDTILNGTIRHVEQLNPHTITIRVAHGRHNEYLLISAHSVNARTHLIKSRLKGQKRSHFADFMLTHIGRATITAIEQVGWDRVLKISLQPKSDDPIEPSPKAIIAEFMGKHSNIILIDEETGVILESIKHVDETMSRYREILPGVTYTPPPQQDKLHPLTLTREKFISLIESQEEVDWRFLFKQIDGLSPTLAKEILARTDEPVTAEGLWQAYQQVVAYFDSGHITPQVLINANDIVAATPMKLYQFPHAERQSFETMNEALSYYYDTIALKEAIRSVRQALNQALDKLMATIDRKLVALHQELANAEQAEDYRIKGELLTANLHRVNPRQTEIEVQNYYSPELSSIQIELNPELSPPENAQQYFKKYTKAKRGRSVISQLIADNEVEQTVMLNYALQIEQAETIEKLLAIREELVKRGWVKDGKQKGKKKEGTEGAFRKYTSPNGFQIYVGRNNKENDLLLRQIASGRDMWLHAKQIQGSHVIIRNPENKPSMPMPTLLQAAQIAAAHSKARHASYVPVDYTWVRYVTKRKGNVAGFVHYTHEKTLYVEPGRPGKEREA